MARSDDGYDGVALQKSEGVLPMRTKARTSYVKSTGSSEARQAFRTEKFGWAKA
jgi:DNA-dependent RNA polymerase auxiliary subunit epsilon